MNSSRQIKSRISLRIVLISLYVLMIVAIPRLYGIGHDIVNFDEQHFRNASYLFMQNFESGRYDSLYVTVQPAAITIYSNIIGYKGLYFLKDKVGIIHATDKGLDILEERFEKIPKAILLIVLGITLFSVASKAYGTLFSLLFITILSLEPFFLGNNRMMHTDSVPAFLIIISLFLLKLYYKLKPKLTLVTIAVLMGLGIIEKSSTIIVIPLLILFIARKSYKLNRNWLADLLLFSSVTALTMVIFFPAFWGDFWNTWYNITIGSYIEGVRGLDYETRTLAPDISNRGSYWYYFRFLYNKVSEVIILGLLSLLFVKFKEIGLFRSRKALTRSLKGWLEAFNNPIFIVPLVWFVIHELSNKKIPSYLLALFPFLALGAAFGFYEILKRKEKRVVLLILVIILLRAFQFYSLHPDYLLYVNPLSLDKTYDKMDTAWGSGRVKLADELVKRYGPSQTILTGDATTLYLFYPGEVLLGTEYNCEVPFTLYISLSVPTEKTCFSPYLVYDTTISVANSLHFRIYKFVKN